MPTATARATATKSQSLQSASFCELEFWNTYVQCAKGTQNLQNLIRLAKGQQQLLQSYQTQLQLEFKASNQNEKTHRDLQIATVLEEIAYSVYSYAITNSAAALKIAIDFCYAKLAELKAGYSLSRLTIYCINPFIINPVS